MEFVQERIATLHDFGGADPPAPVDRATVVVPMTEREHGTAAAERLFSGLASMAPAPTRVVVPLRAPAGRAAEVADWLDGFDAPVETLWCGGPRLSEALVDAGLDGRGGKGRDVWLGLAAAEGEYVVLHDADAAAFSPADVRKLLFPLDRGRAFSKAYYARVEDGRLYGRLCRLLYEPLVAALADAHDDPALSYLDAFRYALAGETAMTRSVARSVPVERHWGLEVGLLVAAFEAVGAEATAQVDLGRYAHDHRSVAGGGGLTTMAAGVAGALFRALADRGVEPAFESLREQYQKRATQYVRAYGDDAAFNGLDHDRDREREQVAAYAEAVGPPGTDDRLPAWTEAPIDAATVREATAADLAAAREG
jgi:glucosyl-3-phosphoglycerate synthase